MMGSQHEQMAPEIQLARLRENMLLTIEGMRETGIRLVERPCLETCDEYLAALSAARFAATKMRIELEKEESR